MNTVRLSNISIAEFATLIFRESLLPNGILDGKRKERKSSTHNGDSPYCEIR